MSFTLVAEETIVAPRDLKRPDPAIDRITGMPKHWPDVGGEVRKSHRILRCENRGCRALAVGEHPPTTCGKCRR